MDGILDRMIKNTEPALAHVGEEISARELALFYAQRRRFSQPATFDKEGNLVSGMAVRREIPEKPSYPSGPVEDKAAEKARRAFERDLLQLEGRIALERQEMELIGRSAFETEKLRTKQELINEARKAGVELTDADRLKIEALSDAYARAVTEADALRDAYEDVRDESKAFLSGFITDLKNGVDATDALRSALDRIADKLIDMAVNNLVETALGGLTGRGGNLMSGGAGLLSLFGFADGGVASHGRPIPLPRFARGGVSRSAAIFGEAGPEAAVPLPDGRRIPVDLRIPDAPAAQPASGAVSITIAPVFQVENGTPEGVAKMESETMPRIRQIVRDELGQQFDRNPRFRKKGL